jgi:hypothetical protein
MSEGNRSRLSLTQRTEIWSRWKAGHHANAAQDYPAVMWYSLA